MISWKDIKPGTPILNIQPSDFEFHFICVSPFDESKIIVKRYFSSMGVDDYMAVAKDFYKLIGE